MIYWVIAIVILAIAANPWVLNHGFAQFRLWQERHADRNAIRAAAGFMSRWKVYDRKKAADSPLPDNLQTFASKVESIKQKARAQGDPYAFDKAVREMVNGPDLPTQTAAAVDEEIIAGAAKSLAHHVEW